MEGLEEYAEEGSPLNEQSNSRKEPVKEEITHNSSELLQNVKDLRTEMETVKKENDIILRAQEELNQILMDKFQSEGNDKHIGPENTFYQHRSKNSKKGVRPLKFMVTNIGRITNTLAIAVRIITNLEKGNIIPMRKFLENLRR